MTEDLREAPNAPGMDPRKNPPDPMPWAMLALFALPFLGIGLWYLVG